MIYYLLICRSLTYAQRTAKALERVGITAIVTRIPQTITIEGCGYCVKLSAKNYAKSLMILREAELYPKRVFTQYADGNYAEVVV